MAHLDPLEASCPSSITSLFLLSSVFLQVPDVPSGSHIASLVSVSSLSCPSLLQRPSASRATCVERATSHLAFLPSLPFPFLALYDTQLANEHGQWHPCMYSFLSCLGQGWCGRDGVPGAVQGGRVSGWGATATSRR